MLVENPSDLHTLRRLAVARLHLLDGRILHDQVLFLDAQERLWAYENLTKELHSTPWYKGDWYEKALFD